MSKAQRTKVPSSSFNTQNPEVRYTEKFTPKCGEFSQMEHTCVSRPSAHGPAPEPVSGFWEHTLALLVWSWQPQGHGHISVSPPLPEKFAITPLPTHPLLLGTGSFPAWGCCEQGFYDYRLRTGVESRGRGVDVGSALANTW